MSEAFAIDALHCVGRVNDRAAQLGISWDAAHEIIRRAVERGLQTRQLAGLRCVGIDERSFRSGQDYVCVMVVVNGSRVLEVAGPASCTARFSSCCSPLTWPWLWLWCRGHATPVALAISPGRHGSRVSDLLRVRWL